MHLHEHPIEINRRNRVLRRRDSLDADLEILQIGPIGYRQRNRELLPVAHIDLTDADPCLPIGTVAHIQKILVGNRCGSRNRSARRGRIARCLGGRRIRNRNRPRTHIIGESEWNELTDE